MKLSELLQKNISNVSASNLISTALYCIFLSGTGKKKDTKNVFFCDVVKECLAPKINKLYRKKPKSAFLPWPVATVEICPFQ